MRQLIPGAILTLVLAASFTAGQPATASPPTREKVYLTVEEALELAFPEAKIERDRVFLTEEQKRRAKKLAKREIEQGIVRPYIARDAAGKLLGTAYFDTHRVRTMRETIMVVVAPDHRVRRVELLFFGEPPDYVPRASWYGQFPGRRLDDELALGRGIKAVTGATLTARATTDAVRRVLALHIVLDTKEPVGGNVAPVRRGAP